MDALIHAAQGIVNQANKTSTQNSARKERRPTDAPEGTVQRTEHVAAAELKTRVEQILSQLMEAGVKIVATSGSGEARSKEQTARDGRTAESADRDTAESVVRDTRQRLIGDGAPVYPFDKNFLQLNLENLRALVRGDEQTGDEIESRLNRYLGGGASAEAVKAVSGNSPDPAKTAVEAQAAVTIDKMV